MLIQTALATFMAVKKRLNENQNSLLNEQLMLHTYTDV
jgi:hypothetical protein